GELVALLVHALLEVFARAPALGALLEGAAEQTTAERAPGNEAHPVAAARRDHLQLDHAIVEMIDALLADQRQEEALFGDLIGLGDVPAGEVARRHVDDLALSAQRIHR